MALTPVRPFLGSTWSPPSSEPSMGARTYDTYDWFLGSVTLFQPSTKSCAVTSRLTGAWNMTPFLRWNVQVCESLVSQLEAMQGTASISPLAFIWYLTRPSKT